MIDGVQNILNRRSQVDAFANGLSRPQMPESPQEAESTASNDEDASFGDQFLRALSEVNNLEQSAEVHTQKLSTGASDDVVGAVLSAEKAQLAMGTTLKIRQEVLEAYDKIMRMQL